MLMLVPLAIFLLIAVFLYKGLFLNPSDIGSTMIGKPLPEFSLASLETPERKVTVADFQELPALLNVWATWCPTCKAEHAMLNKLAAQGVVVYGVNYKDDSDAARQWLAQLGNPYRFSVEDPGRQPGHQPGRLWRAGDLRHRPEGHRSRQVRWRHR